MRGVNHTCNLCPEESGRIMHSLTARDLAIDSRRQTYNRMQGLHAVVCVAGSLLEKGRGSLVTYIIRVKGLGFWAPGLGFRVCICAYKS